jgi:hypothetical protein
MKLIGAIFKWITKPTLFISGLYQSNGQLLILFFKGHALLQKQRFSFRTVISAVKNAPLQIVHDCVYKQNDTATLALRVI